MQNSRTLSDALKLILIAFLTECYGQFNIKNILRLFRQKGYWHGYVILIFEVLMLWCHG